MLVHITGVAGSGKSTLRDELSARGHTARDADDGFCAWFDAHGARVANVPLHQRTGDWYETHAWLLLPGPVGRLAADCEGRIGFLLGVFGNLDATSERFGARYYLTLPNDLIQSRLRERDGDAYATRFGPHGSGLVWQERAEADYSEHGYAALDAAGSPSDIADDLLRLVGA